MSIDSIVFVLDKRKKGGNGVVKIPNHNRAKLDPTTGLRLLYGNGCILGGPNCFECKLPECKWNGRRNGEKR